MADIKLNPIRSNCDDDDDDRCEPKKHGKKVILYAAASNLSKQIRVGGTGAAATVDPGPIIDPKGLNINPNGGTPDGIATIEIDTERNTGRIIEQSQPEGLMPVAPFRNALGALVYDAEAHHFQISKDRTRLLAFGINSNVAYVYDISGDNKRHPKLINSSNLDVTGFMGPHDACEMNDGTFLVTMSGSMATVPPGKAPGGLALLDRDGNFLVDVIAPSNTMFTSAAISIAIARGLLAYPEFQTHYYYDQLPPGNPNELGFSVTLFNFDLNNPGAGAPLTSYLQQIPLVDGPDTGYYVSSPTWWPVPINGKEVLFAASVATGLWALTRNFGSSDPFVPRLVYKLPAGTGYPQHAAMHAIFLTKGDTTELRYNKLYLTDTWGNTLHVIDMSNGLPSVGQYFGDPGFPVEQVNNPNVHWAAFDPKGKHLYLSNGLFSNYDYYLAKYPPQTNYELRRYDVDREGNVSPEPNLRVEAPRGYEFVKFKLRHGAEIPLNTAAE